MVRAKNISSLPILYFLCDYVVEKYSLRNLRILCASAVKKIKSLLLATHQFPIETISAKTRNLLKFFMLPIFCPHGTIWMIAINGRAKNLFTLPMLCFVCGLYVKKKSIWDVIANAAISIVLPQK
jgi:hypothetical protein